MTLDIFKAIRTRTLRHAATLMFRAGSQKLNDRMLKSPPVSNRIHNASAKHTKTKLLISRAIETLNHRNVKMIKHARLNHCEQLIN